MEKPGLMKSGLSPIINLSQFVNTELKVSPTIKDPSVFCLFSIDDCKVTEVLGPNYKRP